MTDLDKQDERFVRACELAKKHRKGTSIGTYGEKSLHAILKYYFEPDQTRHEIKVAGYVADIANEKGIIEIQTANFNKLRKKIEAYQQEGLPITVVYPIAKTKWLSWVDMQTGEISAKRKSPKAGTPADCFRELYKIKQWLTTPNLQLCLVMMEIEEYRKLDGWSHNKKKGSTRYERMPVKLVEEVWVAKINDYDKLIPLTLPEQFMTKDFQKHSRITLASSQTALNILHYLGVVERVGKKGNAFIYKRAHMKHEMKEA